MTTLQINPAGHPVAFGGRLGFVHAATGPVGVVLCSPWGYEDLCARKSWRVLAENIAGSGFPCIRFDYPGAGDSLDAPETLTFDCWLESVIEAAAALRRQTGVERIILLGQGLGAALAAFAAPKIQGVEALALLAPVVRGAAYLREVSAWAAMIAQSIGIDVEASGTAALSIAGLELPGAVVEAIKSIDLLNLDGLGGVSRAYVAARSGKASEQKLIAHLRGLGVRVEASTYAGYDELMSDPTSAQTPTATFGSVVAWLAETFAAPAADTVAPPVSSATACLHGDGFVEEAFHFGDAGLFGVLCRPVHALPRVAVLMLNSGYDSHLGWARSAVEHGRALARSGAASFRIDSSNIGESPARPGVPQQVLYSETQIQDAQAAVDILHARGFRQILVMGRCSGAYCAFHLALRDPRVSGVVMVNPRRFVWDRRESVEEAINVRSLDHYRDRVLQAATLQRALRGDIDLGRAARGVGRRCLKVVAAKLGGVSAAAALRAQVHRGVAELQARGVRLSLVYSVGDDALTELEKHFGPQGRELATYPMATLSLVEQCDHNFTRKSARESLLSLLRELTLGDLTAHEAAA